MQRIKIMIVDDHQVVRAGIKSLIESQQDLEVVGEAATGREAIDKLRQTQADILLLDLSLPDMSGLEVLRHVRVHYESMGVLILSGFPEAQYGLNVLRGGASGFVGKGTDDSELFRAIRTVARGGRYVGPELADLLVAGVRGDPNAPQHSILSEREFQIFCRLAKGESVSEIANQLYLSVKTVSTYRSRILEKMTMKSNADMTSYAIRNNLVQ
ncbi:MAG TPA: response regulator transcription factor [Steroidobacteraceae bacterium]|nr:response regulator transcription factor [Steroidobacteraceae bacterium]HRX91140.1 response regulator transcription factor [Steroidobacteraceae bacterium]